jgi:hypothetical protein
MSENEFKTICSVTAEYIFLDTREKSTNTSFIQNVDLFTLAKQSFSLHMFISAFATGRLNPKNAAVDRMHLK